ncbi:C2 domain-containing protein [Russula brevipes]|nr:C2 domain-containing protein [Russula brevipes]
MSADLDESRNIRIIVIAADGLAKCDASRLPNPFAVLTVDLGQKHTTGVIENTLNPSWNEHFDVAVKDSSVVTIEVFDQRDSDANKIKSPWVSSICK